MRISLSESLGAVGIGDWLRGLDGVACRAGAVGSMTGGGTAVTRAAACSSGAGMVRGVGSARVATVSRAAAKGPTVGSASSGSISGVVCASSVAVILGSELGVSVSGVGTGCIEGVLELGHSGERVGDGLRSVCDAAGDVGVAPVFGGVSVLVGVLDVSRPSCATSAGFIFETCMTCTRYGESAMQLFYYRMTVNG